jgi:GcrA cell cycle regulator
MPADVMPRKGRAGRLKAPLRGLPPAGGAGGNPQEKESPMSKPASSWNDENIERLRTFWSEGLTASEIGRRLGVTKNTVIGKVWRLELPPRRETPIPRRPEIAFPAADHCFWPIGHPGTADFRFCSQPVWAGKPYCEAHYRRAYVRPADQPIKPGSE